MDFDFVDGVLEVANVNGELAALPRELPRSLSAFDGVSVVLPLLSGSLGD